MTWLDRRQPGGRVTRLTDIAPLCIDTGPDNSSIQTYAARAWNMMDGAIDWAALPFICDLLGVEDPAELIDDMLVIRDHFKRKIANNA